MTKGRTRIVIVKIPEIKEYPSCKKITKNKKPNKPYTMEGIPASVSLAIRTHFTSHESRCAYSVIYTAVPTPNGIAKSNVPTVR